MTARRKVPPLLVRQPVLGLVLTMVALLALAIAPSARTPPPAALLGLLVLGVGAALTRDRIFVGMVLTVPGAALVGFAGDLGGRSGSGTTALALAATLAIAVAAPLVADADAHWSSVGGGPVALAIAGIGVYVCVPDTEEAIVLAVVLLGGALASRLPRLHALGPLGSPPLVGLYVWVGATDARGRHAAFVGVVGALALLVLEPVGARLRGARPAAVRGRAALVVLAGGQVALAAYAGRVPGLQSSVGRAIVLLAPALVVGLGLGVLAGAPRRATPRPTPT